MRTLSRRWFLLGSAGAALAGTAAKAEIVTRAPSYSAPISEDAVASLGAVHEELLSGKVFVVATGKNDGPASGQDVVRFKGMLLSTDLCDRFGFQPAPCYVRAEGSALHFIAVLISAAQGELRFLGRINGDRLVAEADWRRPRWYGDAHVRIWFDGEIADPAGEHSAWLD